MAGAIALLPVMLASVCLLVIFVIPHALAIEKPGSDPTRPSDSIKSEEQDEIQVEESESKNIPNPPKLNDSIYDVRVYGSSVYFYRNFDGSRDPENQKILVVMYVNGKAFRLGWYPTNNAMSAPNLPYRTYLVNDFGRSNYYEFKMSSNTPLSIMSFGIEIDDCPPPDIPRDISEDVLAANGNYDALLKLQTDLIHNLKLSCGSNSDSNDFIGYINEVHNAPSYGAGSHEEDSKTLSILDTSLLGDISQSADYKLTYTIQIGRPTPLEVQK